MYWVYILLCNDNSLYTGISNDVARRFEQHQLGTASKYTRAKGVKALMYTEKCGKKGKALKREAAIKKLTTVKKWQLISDSRLQDVDSK